MQPNEQSQHPIDYLNSISTAPEKSNKKGDMLFFVALLVGVLVALIVAGFALLGSGPSNKDDLSRLSVRLTNLQSTTNSAQKNVVSSKLRATNTSLSLALTNANRDITDHLTAQSIDPKKISTKITNEEKTDTLTEKLEDARLNANFDRTYAREMSYQLETTIALLGQLEAKTKNTDLKEYLIATRDNIVPLQKQFADFNASTN